MAPGRTVPWCCWEEWYIVRNWLLSQLHDDIRRGIHRVEAWRARGRLPLGIDITASLLETALCDASFWRPAAATAVAGQSAAAPSNVSQQQIRLQYAATIVRFVNGIADSQQKGRVAVSVNSLAEAAGLSRLLVDVRHEATHNELPSLSTLQLAAKQALDWLVLQYWQRQADHLQACHARVHGILAAVWESCQAAAAKNATTAAAAADFEDDEQGDQERAGGYTASEGRKQRKQLLAELKSLIPPSHTALLVTLLLDGNALQLQQQQQQDVQQQQQQQQQRKVDRPSRMAQITALTSLAKQYPDLKALLLEEAVYRLASPPHQQQQDEQQQQQDETTGATGTILAWLQLLLPQSGAPVVAAAASAGPGSSKASSKGKHQQQQQMSVAGHVSTTLLRKLLATVAKTRAATAAGPTNIGQDLQVAQQLLSAALVTAPRQTATATKPGGSSSSNAVVLLQRLGELAAPHGQLQQQEEERAAAGSEWQQQQQQQLQCALELQQQLGRKRKRDAQDATPVADDVGLKAPPAAAAAARQKKLWQRVSNWEPCAIGCLPTSHQPRELLAVLQSSTAAAGDGSNDEVAAAAATAPEGAAGTDATVHASGSDCCPARATPAEDALATDIENAVTADATDDEVVDMAATVVEGDAEGVLMEGSEVGSVVTFGQRWRLDRQDLGQLQQAVKVLL